MFQPALSTMTLQLSVNVNYDPVSKVLPVFGAFSFPLCTVTRVNGHGLLQGRTERITTMYICCDVTGSLLLRPWSFLQSTGSRSEN